MTPHTPAHSTDTIAAQATPAGRGGVAIIRISGPLVKTVMDEILGAAVPPRVASHKPFLDESGAVIDEGIALYFPNPHSFTGEDVLELQGHGGPVVVDLLLRRIFALGVRMARPGEFSERAFLNGKMDLAQAEAVADLINASSHQAARSAMRSLQGDFSRDIHALNEKIIYLRMYVEAAIDFTDEEIDFLADERIVAQMRSILTDFAVLQSKAKQGSLLREGITAVIAGKPNVGKSSLLNALSGKDIAIVTDIPGTTRDVLRDYLLIDGMPMHIIDTAGLRESEDVIEQEGIRRAHQEMSKADLLIYVMTADSQTPLVSMDIPEATAGRPVIIVRNKIDLYGEKPSVTCLQDKTIVSLSARSGEGMDLLREQIKLLAGFQGETDGVYLARRRHLDAISRAASHINAAIEQLTTVRAGELAAEELRLAQLALNEITGEFTADDLLGRIFSTFCIGK